MQTYIALFRGINIGGNNIIPMSELVAILEKVGMKDIKTYLQSGNAVFRSGENDASKLSSEISNEIEKKRGFKSKLLLLDVKEMKKAIELNPFPEAE